MLRTIVFATALLFTGLTYASDLPDLNKTPGVSRAGLTKAKICSIKWGKDEKHVTQKMKDQVFAAMAFRAMTIPSASRREIGVVKLII
jgi:hypothetical protein